jgi:outer membrane scaffolding protein for murein synthesis (MipA/OmpV family)
MLNARAHGLTLLQCMACVAACSLACDSRAQTTALADAPAAPGPQPWTYSIGLRTEMPDLRQPGSLQLRASLGLRYGRWRIGQTDGQNWHRFGQALQDNSLTYDLKQDTQWSVSLSGSIVNLDNSGQFDALKAGRKTLRAKAGLDYRLPNRWSLGLIATQDVFMRGEGTTLSPVVNYRQPLSEDSTLMFSQSLTWANAAHWQTQQHLAPSAATHQGTGFGELGTQLAYRHRLSRHWALFSQLAAQRALQPIVTSSSTSAPYWNYSAQLGVMYFDQ